MKKLQSIIAPLVTVVIIIAIWELIVRGLHVSEKLFPAPSAIWASLIKNFSTVIYKDLFISLKNIFFGYIIAVPIAFIIAAVCSQFKIVTKMITPILLILMITPMSTLVPILKLNLGATAGLKILVIILQVTPVVALNSLVGFANPPEKNVAVLKAMGCKRWNIFFRVVFPNAMPQVFTGMELGCILGTIASMAADISVGQGGLGYRVSIYASFTATASAFATIVIAALVGVLFFEVVATAEKLIIKWK